MKTKHLVVSMHDVTPARAEATKQCMDMLDSINVPASSLLVVPCYHDTELNSSPEFVNWLHQRQQKGDEIVLHGFRHIVEKIYIFAIILFFPFNRGGKSLFTFGMLTSCRKILQCKKISSFSA